MPYTEIKNIPYINRKLQTIPYISRRFIHYFFLYLYESQANIHVPTSFQRNVLFKTSATSPKSPKHDHINLITL